MEVAQTQGKFNPVSDAYILSILLYTNIRLLCNTLYRNFCTKTIGSEQVYLLFSICDKA